MATYTPQISVNTSMVPSVGNGGEPIYRHDADSSVGTLSINWWYSPGHPYRRRFVCWRISITSNGYGDVSTVHSPPNFTTESEVVTLNYQDVDAQNRPIYYVEAVAVFDDGNYTPQPGDPYKKVTVTVVNGTGNDPTTHKASGKVAVNGKSSTTSTSDTGTAKTDGSSGFSYTATATPEEGYKFEKWNDGNTSSTRSGTAYEDTTFTAYFKKLHSVKFLEHEIGGVKQEVCINTAYVNGNYEGNHEKDETITISFSPAQGAKAVRFRAAKVTDGDNDNATTLWTADGDTTKTFEMPDADVLVVIGCFYDEITVTPQIYTDGELGSEGGSVSPESLSGKKSGEDVSFTATANDEYKLDSSSSGGYAWNWVGDIFDMDGQSRTRDGNSSSATLAGDASAKFSSLPNWTGLDDLTDTWFMLSGYETPNVYFVATHEHTLTIICTAHEYAQKCIVDVSYENASPTSHTGSFSDSVTVDTRKGLSGTLRIRSDSGYFLCRASYIAEYSDGDWNMLGWFVPGFLRQKPEQLSGTIYDPANERSHLRTIRLDIGAWPKPTGKILYAPDNGGAILCGDGGMPMAQYV